MLRKLFRDESGQATFEYLFLLVLGFAAGALFFIYLAKWVLGPMQGPTAEGPGGATPAISRSSHHTWNH